MFDMGIYRPLVSIILPTYNRPVMTERAIKSALRQSYDNIELIVVDDGSTDRTPEVIQEFEDKRIKFCRHSENKGQAAAENTGIDRSSGKFIGFLDSDTTWLKEKVKKQLSVFRQSSKKVGIVYCSSFKKSSRYLKESENEEVEEDIFQSLISGNIKITTSRILARRKYIKEIGGWDENLPSYIDFDLCLRMAKKFKFKAVNEPLVISHDHQKYRITTDYQRKKDGIKYIIEKWKQDIEDAYDGGAEAFRLRFMSSIHRSLAIYNARRRNIIRSIYMFQKYINSPVRTNKKFCVFLLLSLVSPKLAKLSQSIWYSISGSRKNKIVM